MNIFVLLRAILFYRDTLIHWNIDKFKYTNDDIPHCSSAVYAHCAYIISEAEKLVRNKESEKALEMVMFVQGIFWAEGVYTLKELEKHLN